MRLNMRQQRRSQPAAKERALLLIGQGPCHRDLAEGLASGFRKSDHLCIREFAHGSCP